MHAAGRDRGDVSEVGHLNGCRAIAKIAITQHPADPVAPGPHRAVGFQGGAVVVRSSCNLYHACEGRNQDGHIAVGVRSVAELSIRVVAPGPHSTVGCNCQVMGGSCSDCDDIREAHDLHRSVALRP